MLSIFPTLLAYGFFGITIVRVSIGITFLTLGYRTLTKERSGILSDIRKFKYFRPLFFLILLAAFETIVALSLLAGLYTQIGALIGALIALKLLVLNLIGKSVTPHPRSFYALLFIITFSLLFIGPGMYAFDLPL